MRAAKRDERPLLTIETDGVGRRAVLSAVGEVDVSTAAELRAAIDAVGGEASELWLDFTETSFMDSSGLHILLEARASLGGAVRRLVLICPEGPVLRVMRVAGLERAFDMHPTRTQAHYAS